MSTLSMRKVALSTISSLPLEILETKTHQRHAYRHTMFQPEGGWIAACGRWCRLCREPFATWHDHVRLRSPTSQHYPLEVVFDQYVKNEVRMWAPQSVYISVGLMPSDMQRLASIHQVVNHREHRNIHILRGILRDLYEEGHLISATFPAARKELKFYNDYGSRICPMLLCRVSMMLYPKADVGLLSSFQQSYIDNYNLENVFDQLELAGIVSPLWLEQGGPVGSLELTQSKARCIRSLAGDLFELTRKCTGTRSGVSASRRVMALYALRALHAEIVLCRMREWALVADEVWRELYCMQPPQSREMTAVSGVAIDRPFLTENIQSHFFPKVFPETRIT